MKLEVKYWPKDQKPVIDEKVDEAIETVLKSLGFKRWASGRSFVNGCRDLVFDRPGEE